MANKYEHEFQYKGKNFLVRVSNLTENKITACGEGGEYVKDLGSFGRLSLY